MEVMAKSTKKSKAEPDSVYFLKMTLYVIVGSQWIWLTNTTGSKEVPLPLGLIIGLWFAAHDHFQIDRKIEYALLLVATFVGFWVQTGLYIRVLN